MKQIFLKTNCNSTEQLFENVSDVLLNKKIINEYFLNAIIKREQEFPTGLETAQFVENGYNVAIPHVESDYCTKDALVFVLNDVQLEWYEMVNKHKINVKFFIFIISSNSTVHMNFLPKVIELFKNKNFQNELTKIRDKSHLELLVKQNFEEKND